MEETKDIGKDTLYARFVALVQEDVPHHMEGFFYCMGATPLVLFSVAALTGILMTFYYIPYPEKAYESVWGITYSIRFGGFVRGLHRLSVNLMVFTLMLHILRVFITRAYTGNGALKWLLGATLFFITLAMGFTGYSLVYDQVSYWGMTVVMNMIDEVPVMGPMLAYLLRGGPEVSEITLLRLYDLHTKLLPVLLVMLAGAHIVAIRMAGFARLDNGDALPPHPFIPDHAVKVGVIALSLVVLLSNLAVLFPPSLGPEANPLEVAPDVAPPWYFAPMYRWITIAPRGPAFFSVLAFSVVFFFYPYMDAFLEKRGFRMKRVNLTVATAAVAVFVSLLILEILS